MERYHGNDKVGLLSRSRARIGLEGKFLVQPALLDEPGLSPGPERPEHFSDTPKFWIPASPFHYHVKPEKRSMGLDEVGRLF